jgi:DNA-binding NarL/FixJ family response regulator
MAMETETETNTRTGSVRILLAEDHILVRDGLRDMLGLTPDLEVVGEASNGREALELCRTLQPELVLMDVRMPEMDGLQATRAIKRKHPGIAILMVTMYENPDYLLEALEAGAAGYVLKDAPAQRLINAVRRTLNGESPLDQELAAHSLRRLAEERKQSVPEVRKRRNLLREALSERLTPREEEVLELLASGQTNREIAQTLVISTGTAKVHVQHIIRKLGVSDRTQAAVRAIELGFLTLGRN